MDKDLKQNYQVLFATDDGTKVLDDMQKRFHVDQSTFSSDALEMAFLEGQRSVVLFILRSITDEKEIKQDE
ncbi:MAG: hypothetical protein CMB77_02420 [Euryarchaeota archaeon]|nr:hypothetical protein [Euryarchaeota archaeon]